MNSHRFARTGRCRFMICCGMLILIIGMVAIFHSTQLQLDESRQQRLLCEQEQDALSERLTSLTQQKLHMEKHHERERHEELESKHNSEQIIKELEEKLQKDKLHFNELQQNHKQLQNEHDTLKAECLKLGQQYQDEKHKLEENLQHIIKELKHDKDVQLEETNMWKSKYNTILHEKTELEASINKQEVEKLRAKIKLLEVELQKYNNNGRTASELQQNNVINKQFNTAMDKPNSDSNDNNSNNNNHDEDNNNENDMNIKRNQNELIVPKLINIKSNNKMLALSPNAVTPLEAPKNINEQKQKQQQQMALSSPPSTTRSEQQVPIAIMLNINANSTSSTTPRKHLSDDQQQQQQQYKNNDSSTSTSSSNRSPLAIPPKKLPENVAPIPDSFDTFLNKVHDGGNMHHQQQQQQQQPPPLQQQKQSIVIDDKQSMEPKLEALKSIKANNNNNNYDDRSGPHNQNVHSHIRNGNVFLSQHNDDNDEENFFNLPKDQLKSDAQNKLVDVIDKGDHDHVYVKLKSANNDNNANNNNDENVDDDNDSEIHLGDGAHGIRIGDGGGGDHVNDVAIASLGGGAAGDIIVQQIDNNERQQQQQQQHLLDSNNLNNEVAADQGKEFGDGGLRMDEGDVDDADDDDYLNPGERLQGAGKAIRN